MALLALGTTVAQADVSAVAGSAYGYFATVSISGSPQPPVGPTPSVTLPPGGSAVPNTASAPTGSVQYGSVTLFSSGPVDVGSQGTPGPAGSVTSSASIQTVNTSGQEVFTATSVSSTCTATETGSSGSTTIEAGTLQTSETGGPGGTPVVVAIPVNPAPNTTFNGVIESVGDSFQYIFNEQILNPDGSITVNAAHQRFLGPTIVGDLIIGQSVCGVTVAGLASPTISTQASPDVVLGAGNLTDDATVSGRINPVAGATVSFALYGPSDATCTGVPVFSPAPVPYPVAGGPVTSPEFTPTEAGIYRWIASYTGDANNAPVAGSCNDAGESTTVAAATPTITTLASANVALGGQLSDQATVSGLINPVAGATVTFRLYPPTAPTCVGTPEFTDTQPVTLNGAGTIATATSDAFTPLTAGVYRWIATYDGDANNLSVSGTCGEATETRVVGGGAAISDIPTLDIYGMGLLALALAGLASLTLRRRRRNLN